MVGSLPGGLERAVADDSEQGELALCVRQEVRGVGATRAGGQTCRGDSPKPVFHTAWELGMVFTFFKDC